MENIALYQLAINNNIKCSCSVFHICLLYNNCQIDNELQGGHTLNCRLHVCLYFCFIYSLSLKHCTGLHSQTLKKKMGILEKQTMEDSTVVRQHTPTYASFVHTNPAMNRPQGWSERGTHSESSCCVTKNNPLLGSIGCCYMPCRQIRGHWNLYVQHKFSSISKHQLPWQKQI